METKGKFIFKSIKAREGGKFTNQVGQVIEYPASQQVKFDEVIDGESIERKIKVSNDQVQLIALLSELKPYTWVNLIFEVGFNANGCYLKLINAEKIKEN